MTSYDFDPLRSVIGSPGFRPKQSVVDLMEEAKRLGLVRHSSNKFASFHIRTNENLYFEAFLNKRLFQIRATASKDMSPKDNDGGRYNSNSIWLVFDAQSCRYFEVEVSPVPNMSIWMIPIFDGSGRGSFTAGGKLVEINGFSPGKFYFSSNVIADGLWSLIESIQSANDLDIAREPVSQLRLMYIDLIVNKGVKTIDPPEIEKPSWHRWDNRIVRRAWSQARLLAEPLLQVRT